MKLAVAVCCLPMIALAADVLPWRQDEPPNEPYSPQEAIRRMKVPDGFTVELVASESIASAPVTEAFGINSSSITMWYPEEVV